MRDLVQITMPRRAAFALNNLAGLGYYVACVNAGAPVDPNVMRHAITNAINAINNRIPGNATQDEVQEAFNAFALVPVHPDDSVRAETVKTWRGGFGNDGP